MNGDFSRKSLIFAPPCILRPCWKCSLGIGYRRKGSNDGLPGWTRSLTISSVTWIQFTNVTDGHRTTAKTALTHSAARAETRPTVFLHLYLLLNCHFGVLFYQFSRYGGQSKFINTSRDLTTALVGWFIMPWLRRRVFHCTINMVLPVITNTYAWSKNLKKITWPKLRPL